MLKTKDLKTAYLEAENSKYAFMCWEPQNSDIFLEFRPCPDWF